MKSPLERAARALCELDNNPPGATMEGKPLWMDYLPEARAVFQAIREPSDAQREPFTEALHWDDLDQDDVWQTMIDAALEEG